MDTEDVHKRLDEVFMDFARLILDDVKRFRAEGKTEDEIREEILGKTHDILPYFEDHPQFRHRFIEWAKIAVDLALETDG